MSQIDTIAQQLSTVDDSRLLAIVGQLERLRDRAKVEPLIAPARPRLRTLRPQRRMTLQRLNCIPFEDLLVSGTGHTPAGRIGRDAILPSWRIITEQAPQAFDALERQLTEGASFDGIADQVWSHAAEALGQVLARAARDDLLRRQLQRERPSLEEELKTIYRYLSTAEEIQRFKRETGPAPVMEMGETELQHLRSALGRAVASGGSAMHLLMVAAARSANAERVLDVFAGADETCSVLRDEASTVIGGFLFGAIEHQMNRVATIAEPRRLAEGLELLLTKMTATEEMLQRDYGRSPAEYEAEIATVSTLAREVVEHRLVPGARAAVHELLAGLEAHGTLADARPVEDHVRALRHARAFAGQVGAGAVVALTLQSLSREIEDRSLRAVLALARSSANAGTDRVCDPGLSLAGAARLLELSGTSAAAYRLYRAGLNALG